MANIFTDSFRHRLKFPHPDLIAVWYVRLNFKNVILHFKHHRLVGADVLDIICVLWIISPVCHLFSEVPYFFSFPM